MASQDAYYEAVAEEISRKQIDKATWTKAFAESGGDQQAAKSLYCRYRAEHFANDSRRRSRHARATHAKHHGKQLLFGIVAFVIGFGISTVSYASTAPGGYYLVTTGLVVGGFVYICRGLAGLVGSGIRPVSKLQPKPASPTCIMLFCNARCTATGRKSGYTFYQCSRGHEFCI